MTGNQSDRVGEAFEESELLWVVINKPGESGLREFGLRVWVRQS